VLYTALGLLSGAMNRQTVVVVVKDSKVSFPLLLPRKGPVMMMMIQIVP
jgi:hypothetical protein